MGETMVQVTDPTEQQAVREGVVKGEIYSDGEVWAETWSLYEFKSTTSNQAAKSGRT